MAETAFAKLISHLGRLQAHEIVSNACDKARRTEVFVSITGRQHYLWRAIDQDTDVLIILCSTRYLVVITELVSLR